MKTLFQIQAEGFFCAASRLRRRPKALGFDPFFCELSIKRLLLNENADPALRARASQLRQELARRRAERLAGVKTRPGTRMPGVAAGGLVRLPSTPDPEGPAAA